MNCHSIAAESFKASGFDNRRLVKGFENLAETLATFVTLASIQLALRRLAWA